MNKIVFWPEVRVRLVAPAITRRISATLLSTAAEPDELGVGHVGDDMSERRFSGAGRPGQNHGRQTIGFNRAAQ